VLWAKNTAYFSGSPKGKPQIGKIKFRTIKEMNTQIAELLTGGLDWIWDVPKAQAERLKAKSSVVVENAKTMRVSYMAFDVDGSSGQKFFMDKRVRMAVAHAINREAITRNLVGPASVVIHSACHPDQFGCAQDVPKWKYDPALSKKLLAEAGYPKGFSFDIYAYRQREYTEAVIGDLAKVGIKAKLTFLQYRKLRDLVWKGQTPINHMTWGSNSIPDISAITSHFFSGGRDDPAKDPAVIKALEKGDTSTDAGARRAAYKEALTKISGELYWLPMFTYAKYYVYSKDLDFKTTPDEIPRFYAAKWK
jgi:peptide/nickel transport system substrate-binding protein